MWSSRFAVNEVQKTLSKPRWGDAKEDQAEDAVEEGSVVGRAFVGCYQCLEYVSGTQ